jgi:hypothetical protein
MDAEAADRGGSARGAGADATFFGAFLALASIFWLIVAARTSEPAMQAHALLFLFAFVAGGIAIGARHYAGVKDDETAYMFGVVRAGVVASVFWGVAGFLVGLILAPFPPFSTFRNFPSSISADFAPFIPPPSSSLSAAMFCSPPPSMSCSAPAVRDCGAGSLHGSSFSVTTSSSWLQPPAISLASRSRENTPSPNGTRIFG